MTLAQSKGHQVFGTYNEHAVAGTHMKKIHLIDETAVQSLVAETGRDVVINTASLTNVDLCESDF